jgi:uncharacterized protein YjiK
MLLAPSFVSVLVVAGCSASSRPDSRPSDSTVLAQRAARVERALATSDSGQGANKPIARWILPNRLTEISGLALTPDGRLLAHNDETARVFEIDYRRGVIGKQFSLGSQPVHADFEGIAVANETIYLLASNGKLYEFREGADGARVPFTVYNTQLGSECEFEGVAFEAASNSLLLACKIAGKKQRGSNLIIYRWKREGHGTSIALDVPLSRVIGSNGWKGLHPSDLTIDPASGNYVIVSAQEEALVELTPAGEVVSARPLPKGHAHTEGVAITKDGILIISDEAGRQGASLTLYRRR